MQRMGGINGVVLTSDEMFSVTVGQDRKIVLWNNNSNDLVFSRFIDKENDEGLTIDMYSTKLL